MRPINSITGSIGHRYVQNGRRMMSDENRIKTRNIQGKNPPVMANSVPNGS